MYHENENGSVAKLEQISHVRAFVKIARTPGSLESVLAAVNSNAWQVLNLSLQPSLDKAYQFIHVSLEGAGDLDGFGETLCAIPGVKCAEVGPHTVE